MPCTAGCGDVGYTEEAEAKASQDSHTDSTLSLFGEITTTVVVSLLSLLYVAL